MKIVESAVPSRFEINAASEIRLHHMARVLATAWNPDNRTGYGSCIVNEQYVASTRIFDAMLTINDRLVELGRQENAQIVFAPVANRIKAKYEPEIA